MNDDVGNPSKQWSKCIQSEDTLSNSTVSGSILSSSSSSLDCLSHCSSVKSSVIVEENDTAEKDNSVKLKGSTVQTRSGRMVKPVRRLIESMSMLMTEPGKKETLTALIQMLSTFVEI